MMYKISVESLNFQITFLTTFYCCGILNKVPVKQPENLIRDGGRRMKQATINQVRRAVNSHIGSKVRIHANKGRHKVDITEGVITETYPSIFLIQVENNVEDSFKTVSFSYSDVLTKDVQMTLCN